MTTPIKPPATRIDDIEVLRAWAILLVIVQHLLTPFQVRVEIWVPVTAWFNMEAGVDLFFAISGFVIARSLLPILGAAGGARSRIRTILAFWIRRVFRLFPSVWFWLAFILVCAAIMPQTRMWGSLGTNLEATLSVVLYYANYRFATHIMTAPFGASFPYWSLSLEEQFYVFLPLLVLLLRDRRLLVAALAGVIIYQFAVTRDLFGIMFRCEGLAFGVLLAMAQNTALYDRLNPAFMGRRAIRWLLLPFLFVALAGIHSANVVEGLGLTHSRAYNFVACVAAAIVFFASYDSNYIMAPGRVKSILVWIGARSYALYLCHIPSYYLAIEFARSTGLLAANKSLGMVVAVGVAIPLMMLFAHLNYIYIEAPLNAYGRRNAKRFAARLCPDPEEWGALGPSRKTADLETMSPVDQTADNTGSRHTPGPPHVPVSAPRGDSGDSGTN